MRKALLLDLGDTLQHDLVLFEDVPAALDILLKLLASKGGRLALVSDYTMPEPGASAKRVDSLVEEYVATVRKLGILDYFSPPQECITLSTRAGVRKPNRRVFELALKNLGLPVDLSTAIFITEDHAHVVAGAALGMTTLEYGLDFLEWSAAPLLVARLLAVTAPDALLPALDLRVSRVYGQRLLSAVAGEDGSFVAMVDADPPFPAHIHLDDRGDLALMDTPQAGSPDDARFRAMLIANAELAPADDPNAPGTTHVETIKPDGTATVKRTRFSIK